MGYDLLALDYKKKRFTLENQVPKKESAVSLEYTKVVTTLQPPSSDPPRMTNPSAMFGETRLSCMHFGEGSRLSLLVSL